MNMLIAPPTRAAHTALVLGLAWLVPIASAQTDAGLARSGAALFAQHCQSCHAKPPRMEDASSPHAAAFSLRMQLRVGVGAMPAFSPQALKDDELVELVNYVLAAQEKAAATH